LREKIFFEKKNIFEKKQNILDFGLGIFGLKLGKNILFAIGNMTEFRSSKQAKKNLVNHI